jgi:hypothetical protein
MGPKILKNTDNVNETGVEPIKAKRGRKSKKELMASLNMEQIIKPKDTNKSTEIANTISLSVNEVDNNKVEVAEGEKEEGEKEDGEKEDGEKEEGENTNIYENVLNENLDESNNMIVVTTIEVSDEIKPAIKKRGRKPKGGKIVQQVVSTENQIEDKQNVILHLKCSMKDLQITNSQINVVESYNFSGGKNELSYDLLASEKVNSNSVFNNEKTANNSSCLEDEEDAVICKDVNKEIWKKLKQLEHNLHINNVNNKRSACFFDTCEFDNPPIYIPKHFINGTYHVYGCFCSPECGVAYLMNESIDSSTKFERYHLFNHIYAKIYNYKKNIKPAPNPYYMLERYYGNLSIQEYRSLLRNERLFLIVDKPLTRILPELHEDNDDFILNNKIIPSNAYQVKTKLQRKKQNKTYIINEQFGISNQSVLE